MLRRVVIGVAIACLMGGAAYAVDEEAASTTSAPPSWLLRKKPCMTGSSRTR